MIELENYLLAVFKKEVIVVMINIYIHLIHLLDKYPLVIEKISRDAVEYASNESKWRSMSAHARAQVLYYAAENLDIRNKNLHKPF